MASSRPSKGTSNCVHPEHAHALCRPSSLSPAVGAGLDRVHHETGPSGGEQRRLRRRDGPRLWDSLDTDSSGGPGTAGGAQANGAGAQAKSLICGMTRGDGVTKAFAQCPGCPGQPLYKSIRYKDTEVPCAVCGNALPFTRFVVKDNKLVDNALRGGWK